MSRNPGILPAALLLAAPCMASDVVIALPAAAPQVTFAAAKLDAALRASGHSPVHSQSTQADIIVRFAARRTEIPAGGFEIRKSPANRVQVLAADESGAMYGILDLAEQTRAAGFARVEARKSAPRFPFRAIKFNLPWSSYRVGESLQQHAATLGDLKFWAAFLDMMAENRFNVLTLWALHPWPYMIRAANFPKACPFSDRELQDWQRFWHTLFAMARNRGIRLASFYSSGWDFSLYSEGFLDRSNYTRDQAPFISINDFIEHPPLDPAYVSIKDYVANPGAFDSTRVTPPRLAGALEQDARAAIKLASAIDIRRARNAATLACELDDVRTWAALSLYMADKLRAGVALATARSAGSQSERAKAVELLERAAGQWDEVIRITKSHLQPAPLMHLDRFPFMKLTAPNGPRFFWENYRQDVKRDIEIARSQ